MSVHDRLNNTFHSVSHLAPYVLRGLCPYALVIYGNLVAFSFSLKEN